jgi:hypothetical protein
VKVFLSWSGERSKLLAIALREWLPLVLHYAEPWLSQRDISAGDRWATELGKELEGSNFGIICLTKENLSASWILFEAGALSKMLSISSVCPYLLDVEFSDISGPLAQFQAKKIDRESTLELIQAINGRAINPIDSGRLLELFELLWPAFKQRIEKIPLAQGKSEPLRSPQEILEELVVLVRTTDSRLTFIQNQMIDLQKELPSPNRSNDKGINEDMSPYTIMIPNSAWTMDEERNRISEYLKRILSNMEPGYGAFVQLQEGEDKQRMREALIAAASALNIGLKFQPLRNKNQLQFRIIKPKE